MGDLIPIATKIRRSTGVFDGDGREILLILDPDGPSVILRPKGARAGECDKVFPVGELWGGAGGVGKGDIRRVVAAIKPRIYIDPGIAPGSAKTAFCDLLDRMAREEAEEDLP